MNNLIFSAVSIFLINFAAQAQIDPEKVPVFFDKLYISDGFDSNDHVDILGHGMFNNSCYRYAETKVYINQSAMRIQVQPIAYKYPGYCLQMMVPFWKVFDVGILKAGHWEVYQGENEKIGSFDISQATTNDPDDFIYAPVTQAFYRQTNKSKKIQLTGEFTNDCMSITEVKVNVQKNVLLLQPIAEIENRTNCKSGIYPFTKDVAIDPPAGSYLLQVRSMNGNRVNSLITVK